MKITIRKCEKEGCKKAGECWRKLCPERENQDYITPTFNKNGDCNYFFNWKMIQ